jgi:hypothetical protein
VRCDDELGVLASGDGDGDGRWEAASRSTAVDDLSNSADVDGVALEGFDEGFFELGSADGIENLKESGGRAADIVTALGNDAEACGLRATRCSCEPEPERERRQEGAVDAGYRSALNSPNYMEGTANRPLTRRIFCRMHSGRTSLATTITLTTTSSRNFDPISKNVQQSVSSAE